MAKIDLKAKTMGVGEQTAGETASTHVESDKPLDSFESLGGSEWKALNGGGISGALETFGDQLKQTIDQGVMGLPASAFIPANPLGLKIQKPKKDEYLNKFQPVELPPSLTETAVLFPKLPENAKAQEEIMPDIVNAINDARLHYESFIELYNERKYNAERAISGGQLSPNQVNIMRQLISKLDYAINYTQHQIDGLKKYENKISGEKKI